MMLGMPTLIEAENIENCAKLCKELGLNFIELNMNIPQYNSEHIDIHKLKQISEKYDIFYTFHIDENLNPWDFNNTISNAYTQIAIETIEIAKQLEGSIINIHMTSGVYFTLPDKKTYLYEKYSDKYLQRTREFSHKCKQAISESQIKICIENSDGFRCFQKKALEIFLANHCFYLTFDIGHNYSIGNLDENFILDHKNKIIHMHFHDANNKKNHIPLGMGEIDLLKYFDLAKKLKSTIVLEAKTINGLKESVNWIKNNL